MEEIIKVNNLCKKFQLSDSKGSFFLGFQKKKKNIYAVKDISFAINKGEKVAFIGPNGAGKSTTIKMLSAILHPTSGSAEVCGMIPWENRSKLAYKIGTVFGQRSQLWQDLPVQDSFGLLARIYNLDTMEAKKNLLRLIRLFEIKDILPHPVKSLSLGQRMRCEIVASLLHKPQVLFLDEPTIGLDVTAKNIIRNLIKKQALEQETTLLLTSHDTADMEQVCEKVIILNKGKIIFNDSLSKLKATYLNRKYIEITTESGEKIHSTVNTVETPVSKELSNLAKQYRITDLTVENPPMDEIIREIYARDE